jgi:hypothetical protein
MEFLRVLPTKLRDYARDYAKRSVFEAFQWVRQGGMFWMWLFIAIAICLVFYVLSGTLPDRVRWAGSFFEFMGVFAVVISINKARLSFGKPSVLRAMLIWLGDVRFIFFRRPTHVLSAAGIMAGVSSTAPVLTVNRVPKSTEERIDQLEKKLTELEDNLRKLDSKADQYKRELLDKIEGEAAERRAGDAGVTKQLEEGMIGDSSLEIAGIAYLVLGLVMANLSTEVADTLKWFGMS